MVAVKRNALLGLSISCTFGKSRLCGLNRIFYFRTPASNICADGQKNQRETLGVYIEDFNKLVKVGCSIYITGYKCTDPCSIYQVQVMAILISFLRDEIFSENILTR